MVDSPLAEQRAVIGDAALLVLRSHGVAGMTVRRVAEEAGCSTTGVYTWFGGKQGLLDELFIQGFSDFMCTVFPQEQSLPLVQASSRYRRWALDHSDEYLLMFAARASGYSPGSVAWEAADAAYGALVEAVAGEAGSSQDSPLTVRIAAQLWAFLHGRVMLELAGPPEQPLEPEEVLLSGVDVVLAQIR
ncbi:TetR/AcrR family transcriptional regulator [Demequina sediminicola]|uniref:TetR/AcrR family transcriptional regulator n=1 Tax=Demequina sediminicola TaxID=1095026 RepID=UPI0007813432|nr:TetR/AcrR family transcriptional regulator [Demequina sediminicola]